LSNDPKIYFHVLRAPNEHIYEKKMRNDFCTEPSL